MRYSIAASAYSAAYLALLLLSAGALGWLLAAFQVPWPLWLVSLGVTLHLIYSGTAAIALSVGWVVSIMFVAAARKSWPTVWGSQLPYEQAQLWAEGLLLIWVGVTGLVLLLAFVRSVPLWLGKRSRIYGLIGSIWGAIWGGALCYQLWHR